jgi:hypothetical protein
LILIAARPSTTLGAPAVRSPQSAGRYNQRFMLPATFQTPAAIILLLGGLLACFAG